MDATKTFDWAQQKAEEALNPRGFPADWIAEPAGNRQQRRDADKQARREAAKKRTKHLGTVLG